MILEEALVLVNWGCILTRPGVDGFLGRGNVPILVQFGIDGGSRSLSLEDVQASDWYVVGDCVEDESIEFFWEIS